MIPELEAIGSLPCAALAVVVLLVAATAVGERALQWAPLPLPHALDRRIISLGLGLNLIGFIGLTIGMLTGLVGSASIWLLCGLCCLHIINGRITLSALRSPLRSLLSFKSPLKSLRKLPSGSVLMFGIAALTLGPGLCYPTGWDELVYHSELPRRWAADGRPLVYPDLVYSGFPSLSEILAWLIGPIESIIAPRLLNWCCWILSLLAGWRLLRIQSVPEGSAMVITSAIAVSPAVLLIGANCYVETFVLMNFACLLLIMEASSAASNAATKTQSAELSDRQGLGTAVLLGVFAGAAAAVKLTGLVAVVIPAGWYLFQAMTKRTKKATWKRSATVSLIAACCFLAPFYIRPWLATGNPFYPYLSQWLLSTPIEQEVGRFHHFIGGNFGVRSLATFFTGPVLLAFQEDLYDGHLGWQFLILLGLVSIAIVCEVVGKSFRKDSAESTLLSTAFPAFCVLLLYTFWFLTAQQARFIVPALMPMVVIVGRGYRELSGVARKLVVGSLVISSVISVPWQTAGYYLGSWETTFGQWTWNDYVDDGTGGSYVPITEVLRKQTPEDAQVMLLFEHRGLYIPRRYTIGTPYFQSTGLSEVAPPMSSESLVTHLKSAGVTHVVMANSPIGPDRAVEWFDEWDLLFKSIDGAIQRGQLEVLWISEEHAVLEVVGQ